METNLLSIIIFAPLAGAAINWLLGRRVRNERFVATVACGSVAVSTIVAFYLAFNSHGALRTEEPLFDHIWTWLSVGNFHADFALAMDRLSGTYALFVTFVGFLIHVFAVGYMHGEAGFYRFFAFLNLFMFAMLTLVLADNFVLMFVGWEGVGLCSYLLIGYYFDRKEAGDAAKKAFITNRIGDWGFVLGIMLTFFVTGSVSFFANPAAGEATQTALSFFKNQPVDPFTAGAIVAGGATSIAVLLFIGAAGKSAQIPLYVWLPDAMAGPTPVSALIHAATMVTAGVYLVSRCSAVFVKAPTAMAVVALIGAATAIFAATIGIAQNDIKKALAYSTISQLGYMFLACGVGAFIAGIFHVMTHAFFKALLFLGSGSVIHGMNNEQDMRRMGGLKKYMPITFSTMAAGWLAISGFPLLSGFFSKDEILWRTWSTGVLPGNWGKALWVVGAITAVITAVYMTRLMVMTFWGSERFEEAHDGHHDGAGHGHTDSGHGDDHGHHGRPHESGWLMAAPLVILAMLSIAGGYVGVPEALGGSNYFERFLEPAIAKAGGHSTVVQDVAAPVTVMAQAEPHGATPAPEAQGAAGAQTANESDHDFKTERLFTLISSALAIFGLVFGWVFFNRNPLWRAPKLLEDKYRLDELYDESVVEPIENLSRDGLWKVIDVRIIDGIVNGVARMFAELAGALRRIQTGFTRDYAAVILIGAIVVIGYFIVSLFGINI